MQQSVVTAVLVSEHGEEAEPVLIDRRGAEVSMKLDDGSELIFDLVELSTTINELSHATLRAA